MTFISASRLVNVKSGARVKVNFMILKTSPFTVRVKLKKDAPYCKMNFFLPDPGVSGVRSMGPLPVSLCHYKSFGRDFADVTLADHDTNSILTDDANRAAWN